jgi:phage terminase large subunit
MPSDLELPELLNIPEKLVPIIDGINYYKYIFLEGGRVGGKTHSVGRLLLYLGEQRRCRITCGREVQNTIDESVHALLKDMIVENSLNYEVQAAKIMHKESGTEIRFKGFRDQGNVNIKGLEGVDILWVDEAQSITKATLDIIVPTMRKQNCVIIFTMNRFLRGDPVYEFCVGREDCLHISINYDENEFCPATSRKEAEECKAKSITDYNHIWLGQPLDKAIDFLFNNAKLYKAATIFPYGELFKAQRVLSLDFSAAGSDKNVATLLERRSNIHWELTEQREWSEPDTDITIGKSIAFHSLWQPDLMICDAGGLGYPLYVTIKKTIPGLIGFNGAGESRQMNAANQRCDGYFCLNEFIDSEWLILKSVVTRKEMETIKKKYHRTGKIYIQSKEEMRGEKPPVPSPDHADSLMMGIWAIKYMLGKVPGLHNESHNIQRINKRRQR